MTGPFQPSRVSGAGKALLLVLLVANLAALYALLAGRPPVITAGQAVSAGADPGRGLVLIRELDETERARRREPVAGAPRPPPRETAEEPGAALVCRAWGPFTGNGALEAAREALLGVADEVEVVLRQVEAAPDYLVYLETDDNPDNARRLMKELESQRIDAYVIAGGPFLNAVSAGVFSNRERAENLVSKLDELGYRPRLEALPRAQDVRHLVARVPEDFRLDGAPWTSCREIASSEEFL